MGVHVCCACCTTGYLRLYNVWMCFVLWWIVSQPRWLCLARLVILICFSFVLFECFCCCCCCFFFPCTTFLLFSLSLHFSIFSFILLSSSLLLPVLPFTQLAVCVCIVLYIVHRIREKITFWYIYYCFGIIFSRPQSISSWLIVCCWSLRILFFLHWLFIHFDIQTKRSHSSAQLISVILLTHTALLWAVLLLVFILYAFPLSLSLSRAARPICADAVGRYVFGKWSEAKLFSCIAYFAVANLTDEPNCSNRLGCTYTSIHWTFGHFRYYIE